MNRTRAGILTAAVAATLVVGVGVAPANADVTSVSGSRACPAGQTLRVSVETRSWDPVKFFLGGRLVYTDSPTYDHYYNYGVRSGSWKVEAPGIMSWLETCSGALIAAQ
jgi:hypothetical protein